MDQQATAAPKRGPGSFCIPRAAVDALIDAKATAYEICAYLALARFTDETGRYSTASISAINRYTGANKVKGGPVDRAIERLKTIPATSRVQAGHGRSGKTRAMAGRSDLGPILIDRVTWCAEKKEAPPDGPTERGQVRFILPEFGESLDRRVWIGNNLVTGIRDFAQPLKALKNAGDVAARLLLSLYAANDMETWGGVRPVGAGSGPWRRYEPVDPHAKRLHGDAQLIRAKEQGEVASIPDAVSGDDNEAYWSALAALRSAGLIYEMVMVLNRNAVKGTLRSGAHYGAIPDDAEPYYELDCRSKHGFKPVGEAGIGGATARTAGELRHPVTVRDEPEWDADGTAISAPASAEFDGTYAAIVPDGFPAMVAGIFRLRFRVSNPKNVGIKGTWARIQQINRDAFEFLQRVRAANKLLQLTMPREFQKPVAAVPS